MGKRNLEDAAIEQNLDAQLFYTNAELFYEPVRQ